MIPVLKKEATKSGISAADKVIINLTPAGVHHALFLDCRKAADASMTEAEIEADVGKILIKVDGEPKMEMLASEVFDIWRYYFARYGAHTVASIIPIWFTRPSLSRLLDRQGLAYGMKGIKSFTCEIDITAVATLVSITPVSYIEPDNNRALGRHLCIRRITDYYASTGKQQIEKIMPIGHADIGVLATHIHQGAGAGVFKDVTVKASAGKGIDTDIYPETKLALHNLLNHDCCRTNQTGWYHIEYCLTNDVTGYLPMAPLTGHRIEVNWGTNAPLAFPILNEEVRGLTGPVA